LTFLIWLIGLITVLRLGFSVIKFILDHFILTSYDLTKYGAKNGGWALITGASDGIGKGYAEELAKAGFNLILVSRTESKLVELKNKFESEHNIKTSIIAADLSSPEIEPILHRIKNEIDKVEKVTFLVNNVGMNTEFPVLFEEMAAKEIDDQIQVNVVLTTKLTQLVIPYLKKNKKSAIITLSSIAASAPSVPYLSVYAGTKAYDAAFSKALYGELRPFGVDVLAISPFFVASSMTHMKRKTFVVRGPNEVAQRSFARLGKDIECTPSWPHVLCRLGFEHSPSSFIISRTSSSMKNAAEKLRARKKQS